MGLRLSGDTARIPKRSTIGCQSGPSDEPSDRVVVSGDVAYRLVTGVQKAKTVEGQILVSTSTVGIANGDEFAPS